MLWPDCKKQMRLVMHKGGSRWHSVCAWCQHRIHSGRKYVIDPENGKLTYHDDCYNLKCKRACGG